MDIDKLEIDIHTNAKELATLIQEGKEDYQDNGSSYGKRSACISTFNKILELLDINYEE